jgi:hypothetical protein
MGTSTRQAPSWPAVVVTIVLAEFRSVLVAETSTVAPGAAVPVTVTGEPSTAVRSVG